MTGLSPSIYRKPLRVTCTRDVVAGTAGLRVEFTTLGGPSLTGRVVGCAKVERGRAVWHVRLRARKLEFEWSNETRDVLLDAAQLGAH